jgi:hypothetical protein
MSDKLIIWCGDSWTAGSGLGTHKKDLRFATLASQLAGADCINLARSGTSIGHLIYKFQQIQRIHHVYTDKKILVLFGLTVPFRLCIVNEQGKLNTVSVNKFDIRAYHEWAHYVFNDRYIIDETCIKLSWLAEQCNKHHINFKFYNILCNSRDFNKSQLVKNLNFADWLVHDQWSTYSELFDIENFDFTKMGLIEKSSHGKNIKHIYMLEDQHPNINGHKKIGCKLGHAINHIF